MAQGAQRSAMPSAQVKQTAKQARVWADGLVELHERTGRGSAGWNRAAGRWAISRAC
jgi:hypothetical protein